MQSRQTGTWRNLGIDTFLKIMIQQTTAKPSKKQKKKDDDAKQWILTTPDHQFNERATDVQKFRHFILFQ